MNLSTPGGVAGGGDYTVTSLISSLHSQRLRDEGAAEGLLSVNVSGLGNHSLTNLTVLVEGTGEPGSGPGMFLHRYSLAHLLVTSIILGIIILSTIIGNVFVIAAIVLERNLQNVANYLIASLAVADLMVAALVMPLAAVNEVSTQWFLGPEICDVWTSMDVVCCTSSILHLVAIAMDRYWAVTNVDYVRNRTARRILLMIAASWIISISISIPPLFGWRDDKSDSNITGVCIISQDWGYTVYSTVGAFYLPLLLIIIIYIKIFQAARKRIRKKNFKTKSAGAGCKQQATELESRGPTESTALTQVETTALTINSPEMEDPEGLPDVGHDCEHSDSSQHSTNHVDEGHKPSQLVAPTSPTMMRENSKMSMLGNVTKNYLHIGRNGTSSPLKKDKERRQKHEKEKLEAKRERKAARTLAIITGSFVTCWLPFFIVAIVRPFCGKNCHYPVMLISIIGWLGYFNSLLNPLIYTVFNPDFRSAFRKILFGKYRGQRHQGRR